MYVVFEGVDESGKSTQIELVKERLDLIFKDNGYNLSVIPIAEPELVDVVDESDDVELVLRFALQRRILHNKYPSYHFQDSSPTIMLSDRSYYSSLAYQSRVNEELGSQFIEVVNSFVSRPVLVFYFDNGACDGYLEDVKKEYLNVLPLSTVYVNTEKYSIAETTSFISKKIIEKWNELFENKYNQWRI